MWTLILRCIRSLLKFGREVSDVDDKLPDEVLYGRSGYLYALLYVKSLYDSDAISGAAIESVGGITISAAFR